MEGPRSPSETEYQKVLDFLNKELRPQSSWSLAHEYPTALTTTNLHNMKIMTEQDEILSHAVIKPLIIRTPLVNFKVGAIGSVVTNSSHRNQGYSKKILDECVNECHQQDCDLAMLWSDLYDFYNKMNFELAGTEISYVFEEEFQAPTNHLKMLKSAHISPDAILKLYNQHTVHSVRTADDIRKLLQIPESTTYTAWDLHGQLVAFAVEGKGADLKGYIHEWGGAVPQLLSLLSHIRKERQAPFTLITPAHSLNMMKNVEQIPGVIKNRGYLGMIRIINEGAFFSKIKRAARTLGIADFVLEKQNGEYVLGLGQDLIIITDPRDLTKVLLGPIIDLPFEKEATKKTVSRFLPLPFWIWGWDSI